MLIFFLSFFLPLKNTKKIFRPKLFFSFSSFLHHQATTNMGVSYHTLEREKIFKEPPKDKFPYPLLQEAVAPHIGSFNALMDGPDGGLLNLAVKDIGSKSVFDSKDVDRLGNKFSSMLQHISKFTFFSPLTIRVCSSR